jgi:hypothetical protein
MKFTKRQLNKLYLDCLDLLNKQKPKFFHLRKMRGIWGLCYYDDDKLEFDYRYSIIPTMFHECIHFLYPNWSETKVLCAESRLMNFITPLQVAECLKIFANKLYRSELKKSFSEK